MATAAWVFGLLLLLFLFGVAFLLPDPTENQAPLIRFFMALLAGFCGFFFVGNMSLKGKIFGQRFAAGGGFALFLVMELFVNPFTIRSKAGDYLPDLVRPDSRLAAAQETLREKGLLSKSADGIRDSATTKAIRDVQAGNDLRLDGALTNATLRALDELPSVPAEGPPSDAGLGFLQPLPASPTPDLRPAPPSNVRVVPPGGAATPTATP